MKPKSPKKIKTKILENLLLLTLRAFGLSAPNPPVAAVLVCRRRFGYHYFGGSTLPAGGAHAEIEALKKYHRKFGRKKHPKAHLYVTLEPCNTTGRTLPCSEAILRERGIRKIISFANDPALPHSSITELYKKGKRALVLTHSHQKREQLISFLLGYFSRVKNRRPRLHLKLAVDTHFAMGVVGQKRVLSNRQALTFSHMLRAQCDAIVFGPNTIVTDIPLGDLRKNRLRSIAIKDKDISKTVCQDYYLEQVLRHKKFLIKNYQQNCHLYQPQRIFIIGGANDQAIKGKISEHYEQFFARQAALDQLYTHRPARYVFLENCVKQWRACHKSHWPEVKHILPKLESDDFGNALTNLLADWGCNEVLVEGGRGLFLTLKSHLQRNDRIYLIKSSNTIKLQKNERLLMAPKFLQEYPYAIRQPLKKDQLCLHVIS